MAQSPLEALVGSMSLAELSQRSGKSVGQIVDWALGSRGGPGRRPVATTAAPSGGGRGRPASGNATGGGGGGGSTRAVNTRTPVGRAAYDEAVLGAVQSSRSPIGAGALRRKVGGTALQVRTALNRLIEGGQINYEGRARATRYTAR
jgi:hypothetical protein